MIQMLKRCLRKLIGQVEFSYEELLVLLRSRQFKIHRPLTYLTTDDLDEPVTPYIIISGVRLLSVPEHLCYNEDEFIPDSSRWS